MVRLIGCLFFILFFFLKAGNLVSQDKIISKENQQWFQYYNQTNINAKWSWLSDVGFRWRDGFQENSQYIVRTSIGYIINPSVRISSGFAHLGFFSSNKIQRFELRPYQEINVKNTFNKISISHRYRIEQRILNH